MKETSFIWGMTPAEIEAGKRLGVMFGIAPIKPVTVSVVPRFDCKLHAARREKTRSWLAAELGKRGATIETLAATIESIGPRVVRVSKRTGTLSIQFASGARWRFAPAELLEVAFAI